MLPELSSQPLAQRRLPQGLATPLHYKATSLDPDLLSPGTQLGEYQIVTQIAQGGMGIIYLAHQPLRQRRVAIKVLRRATALDDTNLQRFFAEARFVSRINHPSIVQVYGLGYSSEVGHYLVMEHLEGVDLHAYRCHYGILSPYEAVSLVCQVLDGLSAVHAAGVIHRDLKPANLFLVERQGRTQVRLLDFGLARLKDPSSSDLHTNPGQTVGTASYMAPEQAIGSREIDERVDLYSLGVILYELITGRRPFRASSSGELLLKHQVSPVPPPSLFAPGLSNGLEAVILECLAKRPEERPKSAAHLKEKLLALLPELSRRPLSAMPFTPPRTSPRRAKMEEIPAEELLLLEELLPGEDQSKQEPDIEIADTEPNLLVALPGGNTIAYSRLSSLDRAIQASIVVILMALGVVTSLVYQ
jgi:serine/threonine protein kinase